MKKTATLIFSLLTISCAALSCDTYPLHYNSAVLEFGSPIGYFQDLLGKTMYKTIKLPSTFVTAEFRINHKFYLEGVLALGSDIGSVIFFAKQYPYPFNYKSFHGTFLAGELLKLNIFKNFYFTPSLDFYYSKVKSFYGDSLVENRNSYSIGPTLGFEYFISKRISFNMDILNIDFGFGFDNAYHPPANYTSSFIEEHGLFSIYKSVSIGIHYNFDWKKKDSN